MSLSFTDEPSRRRLEEEMRISPALRRMAEDYLALSDDIALTLSAGHLLARAEVDEGDYAFFFPEPYTDDADETDALCAMEDYAKEQRIPLVFTDLTDGQAEVLRHRYRFSETYRLAYDENTETDIAEDMGDCRFLLYVTTELSRLEGTPTVQGERITLDAPRAEDAPAFAALCRDTDGMRWYGYDILQDLPHADDLTLLKAFADERMTDLVCPFVIRDRSGACIGELTLFGFDGKGGADLSVRLCAAARGKGLAAEATAAAIHFAAHTLVLQYLYAYVREENTASVALFSRMFDEVVTKDGVRHFTKILHPNIEKI